MTNLPLPLPVLGLIALSMVVGSFFLLQAIEREEKVRSRLTRVIAGDEGRAAVETKSKGGSPLDFVAHVGAALAKTGLLSATTRAQLQQTITAAGLRGNRVFSLFIGSKVLLMLLMPAIAYVLFGRTAQSATSFWAVEGGAAAIGMLAPEWFIKNLRGKHLKQVERGLPDALDMMVICAQAGLGLENAIDRVAQEFVHANKAVAIELAICASEMRIGADRRTALIALGDRTGLETMRRLAGTLIQTMQFGTPLSQALRVLASEMRTDALTKFEERAARLPVFLTLPMILFVLPCVFIIVGGPAGLQISQTMGTAMGGK